MSDSFLVCSVSRMEKFYDFWAGVVSDSFLVGFVSRMEKFYDFGPALCLPPF